MYGHSWGEGAARCFKVDSDFDEASGARLSPIPDCFICPLTTAVMADPVMTADGCMYEREYIEHWIRTRRQQQLPITSPSTNMPLEFTQLVPLLALKKAIEAYMQNRPELKNMPMEKKTLQQAAACLQDDLEVKDRRQQTLCEERDALKVQMERMYHKVARLEEERDLLQSHITRMAEKNGSNVAFPSVAALATPSSISQPGCESKPLPSTMLSRGLWVDDFKTDSRDKSKRPSVQGGNPFTQYNKESKTDSEDESIGSTLFSVLTDVFKSPTGCCARQVDKKH